MLDDIKESIQRIFGNKSIRDVPFGHVSGAIVGIKFKCRTTDVYVYGIDDGSFLIVHRQGDMDTDRTAVNLRDLPYMLRRVKVWINENTDKNAQSSLWSRVRSVFSSVINFNYYHTVFSLVWTFVGIYFIADKTDRGLAMGAIFLISGLACAHEQRHNDMKKKVRDLENRLSRLDNKY